MTRPIFNATIVNWQGDIVPGASVLVTDYTTDESVLIYDADGVAITNPIVVGSDAFCQFTADPGKYTLTATSATYAMSWVIELFENLDNTTRILNLEARDFTQINQKDPCALATTANVSLTGEQTIDGTLTSASRLLVKNQTAPAENGIYITDVGNWLRATDMDADAEVEWATVYVLDGSANGGTRWVAATPTPVVLGTDDLVFIQTGDDAGIQGQIDALTTSVSAKATSAALTVVDDKVDAVTVRVTTAEANIVTNTADIELVKSVTDSLVEDFVLGASTPSDQDSTTFSQTYVLKDPAESKSSLTEIEVFGTGIKATFDMFRFTLSGGVLTKDLTSAQTVSLVEDLNVLTVLNGDFETIVLEVGEYIGFEPQNGIDRNSSADGVFTGYYTSGGLGEVDSYSVGTVNLDVPQIKFTFDAQTVLANASNATALTSRTNTVSLDNAMCVGVIGDSISAGLYSLKSKAWPCLVGNMSDARIINPSQPGRDALGIADDIRNGTLFTAGGVQASEVHIDKLFIVSGANDGYMAGDELYKFQRNYEMALSNALAAGYTPVAMCQVGATDNYRKAIKAAADMVGVEFLDSGVAYRRSDGVPGWQNTSGHLSMRANGLYANPVIEYLEKNPVTQGLKVFRPQPEFTVGTSADLLYDTMYQRFERWKEIDIFHRTIPTANLEYYDAFDEGADLATDYIDIEDEYQLLKNGASLAFEDYALVEFTVPASADNISKLILNMNFPSGSAVYIRDYDYDKSIPGKTTQESINTAYTDVYQDPLGAWVQLSGITTDIDYTVTTIKGRIKNRKITLLVSKAGSWSMSAPSVTVTHDNRAASIQYKKPDLKVIGSDVITTNGFDISLTGWTAGGSTAAYVPIDLANCPYVVLSTASTHVAEIDNTDTLAQAVTIAAADRPRSFALDVWVRKNPKAFVDPTARGWAVGRYIDRTISTYPDDAPVTEETFDLGELVVEIEDGSSFSSAGGVKYTLPVYMNWSRQRVILDIPEGEVGDFIFKLSSSSAKILEVVSAVCSEVES